ncbi:MIT C-terminal domain-containing protein [Roseinatronobacter thiooxidans]|uniref:MIT C-terminal domain-containing protein n=1 Tax=Roseinatronobacter thiooxidans TaxID=121821 RepID=UPI0024AF008C|nr:MIT C-terminal domain-containing protein [Roseinatronobacter thiooxidans]
MHARHLVTDTGWKILLDRGLDVFQRADLNSGFSPAIRHQRFRQVRAFEVTYLRDSVGPAVCSEQWVRAQRGLNWIATGHRGAVGVRRATSATILTLSGLGLEK